MNSRFEPKISGKGFSILSKQVTFSLIFVLTLLLTFSCSVPNLEKPECTESREAVKQFYSFHFGNDMKTDSENLKKRENFLSPRLFEQLKNQPASQNDYFTQTENYPKAFRVGGCEVLSSDKTVFEVLIFWKSETESVQKQLKAEAVKENGKWLIDKVENK